jgi:hypothetical protein
MSNYKQTFGIRSRHKRGNVVKPEKGEPGIGFKLTNDNNYDMDNKRLVNVGDPEEVKDAVNKKYLTNFHRKNEDIDMNNKAIKNLNWPNDINDAVPKKYLYQYGLLLDNKINSFNAKDKKIVNVLDPENLQDVATKNYVDSLDSAIQDSLMKRITDVNNFKPVLAPNLPPNSVDWVRFYEMDLNLYKTVDSRVFILKGTVKIKQDVGSKSNWLGNVPFKENPMSPIVLLVWHLEDNKTYNFVQTEPQTLSRKGIIDQNNKLIVYGDLKGGSTLYFNALISV